MSDCVLCLVKCMGSKSAEKINICSKCILQPCLLQGKMKMVNILNDLQFEHGFCEICINTSQIVNVSICSEHGGYDTIY